VSSTGVSAFAWRQADGMAWLEAALPGARAAFSTRLGGRSAPPYDTLNLGILTDDDPQLVSANRRALAEALGRATEGLAYGMQVHGAAVQVHQPARAGDPAPADAHATSAPGLSPLVVVADCLPVALAAPGAVAMAHCGWRGTVGGVIPNAVEAVTRLSGAAAIEVRAAIGPGIRTCCYEVGPDVRAAFEERGHASAVADRNMLDLAAAVAVELERCGVAAANVADCGLCTSCDPERFFSHRRDSGRTGRQAGLVWLES
jgi:YfiH family protein